MKKICLFGVLLGFSLCLAAQGQGRTDRTAFTLSLAPSFGLLNGYVEEIVYNDSTSKEKLSQLLWNMNPVIYAGFNINMDVFKPQNTWAWFADASFKFGFPMKTGVMEDRDWTASIGGVWIPEFLTHYSVHDNFTDSAVLINVGTGVSFKIFERYLIRAEIAYDFMEFAWSAKGGSFLYPAAATNSDGHLDQRHFYLKDSKEKVITYTQTWHIISPGVSFYGSFNRFFDIDIFLNMSPLVWCNSVDEHLMRDLTIKDTMLFGFFIKPRLLFSYMPTNSITLSLSASYTYIGGTRGPGVYMEEGKADGVHDNGAGAGYSALDVGLIVSIKVLDSRNWGRWSRLRS